MILLSTLFIGANVFAEDVAVATLDSSQVKLTILDGKTALKINDSVKDGQYILLQAGKLVTAKTAAEGAGPVCMLGLAPNASRDLVDGTKMQVGQIVQGAQASGLISLVVITEDKNYLLYCGINDSKYIYRVEELNHTLGDVLRLEVAK